MNIDEAVKEACKRSTLLDALTFICIWESERIVKQAKKKLYDADGKGWDTCFRFCLAGVVKKYNQSLELTGEGWGISDRSKIVQD